MPPIDSSFHFRILEDIAKDLSGDVSFPTCLDAAIMVRNTLKDPEVALDKVVRALSVEPLITSKLLQLANSVAYNPSGVRIVDLKAAISRIGFQVVRTSALAVAIDQMLKSRHVASFDQLARLTWEHSLQVAAIARVLARRVGRGINPDDAMLAGMVHDIGIFYLIYRAAEYEAYRNSPEAMINLVTGWHASIGESLLVALGLPEQIVEAVRDHDEPRHIPEPRTLQDVLYYANLLAGGNYEWLRTEEGAEATETSNADRERYAFLLEEASEDISALRSALSA